jgi:hypothetical protein
VDTRRSFTQQSAHIYYWPNSDTRGDPVQNWRVEWTTDASFSPDRTKNAVVPNNTALNNYNITGLTMGTNYYLRVTPQNSEGFGSHSDSIPFKPHQQPDPPVSPQLTTFSDATSLQDYTRSALVSWSPPSVNSVDPVGDGGDPITSYHIEWMPELVPGLNPFTAGTGTVQTVTICYMSPYSVFSLALTTTNAKDRAHNDLYYFDGEFPVTGTFISGDIFPSSTAWDVKRTLENMPNVAEVSVTKSAGPGCANGGNSLKWVITFNEISPVPLFTVNYYNLIDGSVPTAPVITGTTPTFSTTPPTTGSYYYNWQTVPGTQTSYVVPHLLPNQNYCKYT